MSANRAQKLVWPGCGFYIEVPEGALPPGVTASVAVKVISAGQFKLPENSELVSAIYWISCSEELLKPVSVNIQHCAIITNEEEFTKFKFIIAKCSQECLPYKFAEKKWKFQCFNTVWCYPAETILIYSNYWKMS